MKAADNRRPQWTALHLRRQSSGSRRRSRAHALSQLPRDARRALRLLHPAVSPDRRRALPRLRHGHSRAMGRRIRWPNHVHAVSPRHASAADVVSESRVGAEILTRRTRGRTEKRASGPITLNAPTANVEESKKNRSERNSRTTYAPSRSRRGAYGAALRAESETRSGNTNTS